MTDVSVNKTQNEYAELGRINWFRDYQSAMQESVRTNKPVLLLFQEVPGCKTCINFGQNVLRHPLMAELIEDKFVPLVIFNNHPGDDNHILRKFKEPAWNNPVIYFLDKSRNSIIPKLENNYYPLSMYYKLKELLLKTGNTVPAYFQLLEGDIKIDYGYAHKLYYETPCFWSGETTMAQHPAVISTEAGWVGYKEVVEIYFDTEVASIRELNAFAIEEGIFFSEQ